MLKTLTAAERIVVAANFKPDPKKGQGREWVRGQVLTLAVALKDTGVYLKLGPILRACGYDLIDKVHQFGLNCFADLKLVDIGETLTLDGLLLNESSPEIVTAFCDTDVESLKALKAELRHTEVLGVTVLTNLDDDDVKCRFGCSSIGEAVRQFAGIASQAGLDGVVSAPTEAQMLRTVYGKTLTINVANIRPAGMKVEGDDQNPGRTMTPAQAVLAGADRLIIGRPITGAKDPYDAVMRIIAEIAAATA